jgi:hypothetical protein
MKRTIQYALVAVTVSLCLWVRVSVTFAAQIDNPNPPPDPRSRASSAVDVSAGGVFTASLAITLNAARGPVPNIGLSYSSGGAN